MMIFLGWSADYDKIMVQQLKKSLRCKVLISQKEGLFSGLIKG